MAGDEIRLIPDEIIADHESLRDPYGEFWLVCPNPGFPRTWRTLDNKLYVFKVLVLSSGHKQPVANSCGLPEPDRRFGRQKQLNLDIQRRRAFFELPEGELRRIFPFSPEATGSVRVSTEASPGGIGGVLKFEDQKVAYLTDYNLQGDADLFTRRLETQRLLRSGQPWQSQWQPSSGRASWPCNDLRATHK